MPRRCCCTGFTLLEMIVTLAVLALGVTPVVQVLSVGLVAEEGVEGRVAALALAREKVEAIGDIGSWADVAAAAAPRSSVGGNFAAYDREVLVAGMAPDPGHLKQITVSVYWTSGGSEQNVTLVTLLTSLTS